MTPRIFLSTQGKPCLILLQVDTCSLVPGSLHYGGGEPGTFYHMGDIKDIDIT